MIYISKEYLADDTLERFIDESVQNDDAIIDAIELKQIAIIKTYLGTRYNVALIFDLVAPVHNEVLKDILSKMVTYRLIKRNAARKVPTDFKEDYEAVMKSLKEIATGVFKLDGLPVAIDELGKVVSNSIYGNLKNNNFYI